MECTTVVRSMCATVLASISLAGCAQPSRPLPKEELANLATVYQMLQDDLIHKTNGRDLIIAATKGMVRGADPGAGEYFSIEEYERLRIGIPTPQAALGLVLSLREGKMMLKPIKGGPAMEAGVRAGDQLIALDGVGVVGSSLESLVRGLGGALDSTATLTVARESSMSLHNIQVVRKPIKKAAIEADRPVAAVMRLKLPDFQTKSLDTVAEILRSAWSDQPFKSLILDLRGNQGGLVTEAIGVAAMFLAPDAVVIRSEGSAQSERREYRATVSEYAASGASDPLAKLPAEVRALPLAVLVDEDTASGAEIVAAALQDHGRASIVGRKTLGMAYIRTLRPVPRGVVKYTSGYWVSPSGSNLEGKGVTPDVVVQERDDASILRAALARLAG